MNARIILALALATATSVAPLRAQAPADPLEAERLDQTGTVITIIFDDSGSMSGTKIAQAKAAFRQWIASVPASHRLGLIALNAGPLVPPGRDNRPALLAAVNRIQAGGGTPLVTTIRGALAGIARRRGEVGPYERHILLVFTDGEDTTAEGIAGVQRELARAATAGVETVGIGYHGEGVYLRSAATRYYDANNPAQLEQSLAKVDSEIGDTTDLVIDERTRRAMQTPVALSMPPPADSPRSAPGPAAAAPASRHRGYWLPGGALLIVLLLVRQAIRGRAP